MFYLNPMTAVEHCTQLTSRIIILSVAQFSHSLSLEKLLKVSFFSLDFSYFFSWKVRIPNEISWYFSKYVCCIYVNYLINYISCDFNSYFFAALLEMFSLSQVNKMRLIWVFGDLFKQNIKNLTYFGVTGWFSQSSICLWLKWSQGPGMEHYVIGL